MAFDTTLAAIQAAMKIDYRPLMREQLNNATVLLTKLQRNTDNYVGLEAQLKLHTGRNVGIGSRKEAGTLPTAGNQKYDKAIFNAKYNYGRFQVTGPAISATKSNVGSLVKAVDSEMKGLTKDLKQDVNRQLWHNGSSILTLLGTNASDDHDQTGGTALVVSSTKFLKADMKIELVTTTGTDTSALGVVTVDVVVDGTSFFIKEDGVFDTANTDYIIREDARDSAAWGVHQEMWGLEAALSDGNPGNNLTDLFGSLTRTNSVQWDANVLANAGTARALTLDLMQQAFDQCDIEGDSVPGLILTNHAIKRRYAALLVADKRYPPGGEITLDGGYKALEYNGTPLVADKDASKSADPSSLKRLYFITMSTMSLEVLEDWDWMEKDGAVLSRVANVDAYEGTFFNYMELACDRPNANAVLDDISET